MGHRLFLLSAMLCIVVLQACSRSSAQTNSSETEETEGLRSDYYATRCPRVYDIVRFEVQRAIILEPRTAASLLRLFFHDCIVNGCDASVLLDDTLFWRGEKTASPNKDSLRRYDVIDCIKVELEKACPGVVSCADILAIAARDAVALINGPFWELKLGRKDSLTASYTDAQNYIPQPTDSLFKIFALFERVGFTVEDVTAVLGAHTIGYSRCTSFSQRLYNQSGTLRPDPILEPEFARLLHFVCPPEGNPNKLQPLDYATPISFDTSYYKNLIQGRGLLHSDAILYAKGTPLIKALVERYSYDREAWNKAFAIAMIKMGDLYNPFVRGEVRRCCRRVN